MLNLFTEAFNIINNKKFHKTEKQSFRHIEAILGKLSQQLNSIDQNENRVFTKSMMETHIFALYNRIVGYRNTERGIAMLHSVIDLILKKMLSMRSKDSTISISEPNAHIHGLNGKGSNVIHAENNNTL